MQTDLLTKTGCEIIFQETASGAKTDRVELEKLLSQIRKDVIVVVYKLDRLGRSLKHLLEVVAELNEKKVGIQSISDAIDTTTPQGRLFFNYFSLFCRICKGFDTRANKGRIRSSKSKREKRWSPSRYDQRSLTKSNSGREVL